LPGDFQKQTLLGVHLGGFARGDLEELRIEGVDVAQERAPSSGPGQGSRHLRRAVVIRHPPIGRHLCYRRATLTQKLPQRIWPGYLAGKTTPEADDSDRLIK